MSEPRTLRCYAYVNRPYGAVREVMRSRPLEVFQRATTSAAARASALAASLHASLAGVDVGVDVRIDVRRVTDDEGVAGLSPVSHVMIGWEAARTPGLFPIMNADLSFWALTSGETQLEESRALTGRLSGPWATQSTPRPVIASPRPRCTGSSTTSWSSCARTSLRPRRRRRTDRGARGEGTGELRGTMTPMIPHPLRLGLAAASLLALFACSSSSSSPATVVDAGSDVHVAPGDGGMVVITTSGFDQVVPEELRLRAGRDRLLERHQSVLRSRLPRRRDQRGRPVEVRHGPHPGRGSVHAAGGLGVRRRLRPGRGLLQRWHLRRVHGDRMRRCRGGGRGNGIGGRDGCQARSGDPSSRRFFAVIARGMSCVCTA